MLPKSSRRNWKHWERKSKLFERRMETRNSIHYSTVQYKVFLFAFCVDCFLLQQQDRETKKAIETRHLLFGSVVNAIRKNCRHRRLLAANQTTYARYGTVQYGPEQKLQ
mmetsp:Transcript_16973/g.37091  ORF Transcript_16973/g.37091 Transcript_16973/m.37091 type:complete len:109 (+) Transcript_16973:784-1110(+)